MTAFCKTSRGGINLDNITQWFIEDDGDLIVWFCAPGDIEESESGQDRAEFEDEEAARLIAILESVCIFDATVDKTP